MQPNGGFSRQIMLIGGKPGRIDDATRTYWNGEAGELLRSTLARLGVDVDGDCVSVNAVNCMPPQNRFPQPTEIDHCRHVVVSPAIAEYDPLVVLLFGTDAVYSTLGPHFSGAGGAMDKFAGYQIPLNGVWYCPVFGPEYVLKHKKDKHVLTIWMQHLKNALGLTERPATNVDAPRVEIVRDIEFLADLPGGLYAFDYETTGLKPDMDGHDIICCAVADGPDRAWVFLLPDSKRARQPLREFLRRADVKKMAHNMAYEDTWSRVILKVAPRGWVWDSMQAAHILDNRPGVTGLKFQSFVHFGQPAYAEDVEEYFNSGKEHGDNSINGIRRMLQTKTGRDSLLQYCGMDAVLEYRLALKQFKEMGVNL